MIAMPEPGSFWQASIQAVTAGCRPSPSSALMMHSHMWLEALTNSNPLLCQRRYWALRQWMPKRQVPKPSWKVWTHCWHNYTDTDGWKEHWTDSADSACESGMDMIACKVVERNNQCDMLAGIIDTAVMTAWVTNNLHSISQSASWQNHLDAPMLPRHGGQTESLLGRNQPISVQCKKWL